MNQRLRNEGTVHAESGKQKIPGKKNLLWTILFLFIAAASIWAITSQVRSFSFENFVAYLGSASIGWIILALLFMFAYIYLEGAALNVICWGFGYRKRRRDGFVYASADIYFSAITPSATGGQPASAYFMMRDGIPGPVSTVALLINLIMYTLSILVIGLVCFIARPSLFAGFSPAVKVLILGGSAIQICLTLFFVLLLVREKVLHRICDVVLRLLGRLHLLRKPEKRREKLKTSIEDYRRNVGMMAGQRGTLVSSFFLNLLQRTALICVTVCAFRAAGGSAKQMLDAWAIQGYSILGYSFVPIPGAMGVADMMLMDGFGQLMSAESAVNLELLSRTLSFYCCILICGITVLVRQFIKKGRKRGQ